MFEEVLMRGLTSMPGAGVGRPWPDSIALARPVSSWRVVAGAEGKALFFH